MWAETRRAPRLRLENEGPGLICLSAVTIAAASRNRRVSVWFMRRGEVNREAPARAEPRPRPSGRPTGAKHLQGFNPGNGPPVATRPVRKEREV